MSRIDGFHGEVIDPSHSGYDEARAIWNGLIDRRPFVIARPLDASDVAAAVRFARARELEIAVRGGGHNVAGTAVCDDGIVIDLGSMRQVAVDTGARSAAVQGGALWRDVDTATQDHGLAVTGGIVSHTGVAGLTLGGGIGWLMRERGLTADNLVATEVVTADGEIVRASAEERPELFWALRGGGGNFGIVTTFEFALRPVGPEVLAGPVFWAADDTDKVLRFYREYAAEAPRELGTVLKFGTIPPLPVVPAELHWRPAIAINACYTGPPDDAEQVVGPVRSHGSPMVDLLSPKPYLAHQQALDSTVPHGWHYYWKSTNLPELSDGIVDVCADHAFGFDSPRSYAVVFHLGGAIGDVPDDATAYAGRAAAHNININGVWRPGEEELAASETAWTRAFFDALEPYRHGVYVNFLDADDGTTRVREAYGPTTHDRLATIKAEYDPDNVFHLNQNIRPAR